MKPILEIQNIGKRYKIQHLAGGYLSFREKLQNSFSKARHTTEEFWALQDVSFNIYPGESVGIVGRNGAGKSTLLKILSKITPPTTGSITARGRIASLLEVGTGFHLELTGRENIFFNGSLLGMKRKEIEAKFDEIVDFSGVEKFLDTPLKHFSSGMQLRLAFAVAAFLEPEILIIDEVLAVGDAEFQKKCMGKMDEVNRQGRTILFVSHSFDALLRLCNRGILLNRGKIQCDESSMKSVIHTYLLEAGAHHQTGLCEWKKNSDDSYDTDVHNFQNVKLVDNAGRVFNSKIPYSAPINVVISGEIKNPDPTLNIGFSVKTETNETLFWSWAKDSVQGLDDYSHGKFSLMTEIPAKFFNDGKYSIEFFSVLHNRRDLIARGSGPSIDFEIIGGFSGDVFLNANFGWKMTNE
jgi:lipopolysaccharide transport system ATP-binding protein